MVDENIDKLIDDINLNEKTELEGVADQIFKKGVSRTNLNPEEIGMTFTTGIVFDALGMKSKDPTERFMELNKSQQGWSMEKFVQTTNGVNDQRNAGGLGGFIKDRLFKPKQ